LEWVLRDIQKEGGEASLCEARFVEGLLDDQVEALFIAARDADYAAIAEEARSLADSVPGRKPIAPERAGNLLAELSRLKRRYAAVVALDFFGSAGREIADGLLSGLEARLRGGSSSGPRVRPEELRGRTWVTRRGVHVDRMASAWLIRRFVDPGARFKFVPAKGYKPEKGELRFDMFEAEFTHEGDRCTFEVLIERFLLADPALGPIGAVVHDIDL